MSLRRASALALLLAAAGCDVGPAVECLPPVQDSVRATTFAGIAGELYRRGACGVASACLGDGFGRLVIYEAGTTTEVANFAFLRSFRVPLAPGSYDVVIAPYGAYADRTVTGATVAADAGVEIVRSYWEDYDARLLALFFAPGTSSQTGSVLLALDATEVSTVPPASFPEVRVRVAVGTHPDLVGERALATFPDVVLDYQLDPICTDAHWDVEGGWPWDDWD